MQWTPLGKYWNDNSLHTLLPLLLMWVSRLQGQIQPEVKHVCKTSSRFWRIVSLFKDLPAFHSESKISRFLLKRNVVPTHIFKKKKKSVMIFLALGKDSFIWMQETENFPKYNPNLFFKAAARILKILCRFEAPNVTCFVVCIYTECIKKISCGPFPLQWF